MIEKVGKTNARKDLNLAGISTEDTIRKSSQKAFTLSTVRKT
jgi:hypothetical protein